jgi:hypothetical protein
MGNTMAILFFSKNFCKKIRGLQIFQKICFKNSIYFKFKFFHKSRVGAFDSSSKITPGRLAKIICHAKTRRKPEKMAFFEKHLFENAIFLGFLRVSVCQMNFTKRPGVILTRKIFIA